MKKVETMRCGKEVNVIYSFQYEKNNKKILIIP